MWIGSTINPLRPSAGRVFITVKNSFRGQFVQRAWRQDNSCTTPCRKMYISYNSRWSHNAVDDSGRAAEDDNVEKQSHSNNSTCCTHVDGYTIQTRRRLNKSFLSSFQAPIIFFCCPAVQKIGVLCMCMTCAPCTATGHARLAVGQSMLAQLRQDLRHGWRKSCLDHISWCTHLLSRSTLTVV